MDLMDVRREMMGVIAQMAKGVYKNIYSGEVNCTTTSESITNIASITIDGAYTTDKIIYCKIRDKAGKRNGYFFGTDVFSIKGSVAGVYCYKYENNNISFSPTSAGIYLRAINGDGVITIASRYMASYSSTIDGTYTIDVYELDWPDNVSPFN